MKPFSVAGSLLLVLLPAAARPQEETGLLERIRSLYERLQYAPRDSYLNYAIATLARRGGIDLRRKGITFPLAPLVPMNPAARSDIFGLLTGLEGAHESLQLDFLLSPPRAREKAGIPLESLRPPPILPGGYVLLLKSLGKRPIPIDSEARFAPADFLFLRFSSGKALVDFLEEARPWMGHAMTYYREEARSRRVVHRIFCALSLPDPRTAAPLYKAVKGSFALLASDPLFREGTDVSAVLPPGFPLPSLPESGKKDNRREGPPFTARLGGRTVLSSSRVALDEIRGALARPESSLARAPDYRLARASLQALDRSGRLPRPVVTELRPAAEFWEAEEHHQRYLEKQGLEKCHIP